MFGIPKDKRKISPNAAVNTIEKYGGRITLEEAELVLDIMYNFANLALNQQLQQHSEGQDQLFPHPGPGKESRTF